MFQWKILARVFLLLFLTSAVIRAWYNPSGAHGTRQVDTAGLSLALAHDFHIEGLGAFAKTAFYPRVLQRGLSSGINAAEFPLLNLMTAPFFLIGPHWGNFLGCLLILFLNFLAATYGLKRIFISWNTQLPNWLLPVLYFSVGSVAFQAGIFMPEGLAFPLLVLGAAEYCDYFRKGSLQKAVIGIVCLSLSIAVKPMAVVGLLIPGIYPWIAPSISGKKKRILHFYLGILVSLIFPSWWYGIHASELTQLTDGIRVFLKADFRPLTKIQEVGILGLFQLIWRQLNSDTGQWALYSAPFWTPLALIYAPIEFGTLLVTLIAAIALGGAHIWVHFYYFFGAGLCSLIVLAKINHNTFQKPLLRTFSMMILFWGLIYNTRTNIWVTARTPSWWSFSNSLRLTLPKDAHLVTDDTEDATKLLFMGVPGTIASQNIFSICKTEPYRSLKLALLVTDSTSTQSQSTSNSCLKSSQLIQTAKSHFATWKLYEYTPKK